MDIVFFHLQFEYCGTPQKKHAKHQDLAIQENAFTLCLTNISCLRPVLSGRKFSAFSEEDLTVMSAARTHAGCKEFENLLFQIPFLS